MSDLPPIANLLSNVLLFLLFITFLYALSVRFISDTTLYDQINLPMGDPDRLNYTIEPSSHAMGENSLPNIHEPASLYVTFVVPAYNEEKRLPRMLDDTLRYLYERRNAEVNFSFEVIVVDDGSRDNTTGVVLDYASRFEEVKLLRQPKNMGKGAAIQAGCLHTRGAMILMVDADGATTIDEFSKLEEKLLTAQQWNKEVIVVGSRAHLEGENKAQRTPIRKFLGLAFHYLIVMSGVKGINDTQCGFKLFSREAAKWLFPNQHIKRWCFDPELLVIGTSRKMAIIEVPVEWNEIEGSKMKLSAMVKMAIDLVQIAVFYRIGLWTMRNKSDIRRFEEV